MRNAQIEAYAQLLVERSIDVQPGWQVLVVSTPLARPLVEEVVRLIARRGAYALPRVTFAPLHPGALALTIDAIWARAADETLLGELASIDRYAFEHADACIFIGAPENTREGADLSPARLALLRQARRPLLERLAGLKLPWVGCQFPTPALAQESGMPLETFEQVLFDACLLDWDAESSKMRHIAARFDQAERVRIVGGDTDLTLSLCGRHGAVDDGHMNMPGGEIFYSPVENATEGVVTFAEFPASYGGHEVVGARLVFRGGRVVEASARRGADFLIRTLDADPGARVLGEFGIGCNPRVEQYMNNLLFDEKIFGTIHLALGAGFAHLGGRNVSSVHWDLVKDLRQGGQIFCDDELVQADGVWMF